MNQFTNPEMLLRILTEPRRNNFFYGKMLDVPQLRLEQDYGKKKQWLMNRLSLGTGVLCGLGVSLDDGRLCVEAGVAIDPLGREIIVPGRFCIDPFAPKPPCERGWKGPADDPAAVPKGPATLWVCYNECLADHVPAAISDCHGERRCEAGTIVETFKFRITEGAVDGPAFSRDFCVPLWQMFGDRKKPEEPEEPAEEENGEREAGPGDEIIVATKKRRDPHAVLCELLGNDCTVAEGPVCVPIATFSYLGENEVGELKVCEARNRLYSNQVLLELILCLMARIEECCGKHPDPDPGPEPDEMLRITAIEVESGSGQPMRSMTDAELQASRQGMVLPAGFDAIAITIRFNKPVDRESVTLTSGDDDLGKCSMDLEGIRVLPTGGIEFTGYVRGNLLFLDGDKAVRIEIINAPLRPGIYQGEVTGDQDPIRNYVRSAADQRRLDGEADKFPSGRGDEGGRFFFYITVEGEEKPETLRVEAAEMVLGGLSVDPPMLESPDTGIDVLLQQEPVGLRVRFTLPVDRESVTIANSNAELKRATFLVAMTRDGETPAAAVPGDLQYEDDRTVVFRPRRGFRPADYVVWLHGDPGGTHGAILSRDDGRRLDGEPTGLPSGNGVEGGLFKFPLRVKEE